MKLRTPTYFNEFHCIADKCKDCCCIGWEIDIDKKTADFYKNVSGEFGEKLRKSIDFGSPSHFALNDKNRCPLLNNKNLCEVYIQLGEDKMCDICTEHPRYYEWFNNLKEGGIGLCCEEAGRIILSQKQPFTTIEKEIPFEDADTYDMELFNYLLNCRSKIISHIENTEKNFSLKIRNILWYAYTIQLDIDNDMLDDEEIFDIIDYEKTDITPILNFYTTLDPLNPDWIPYLKHSILTYINSKNYLHNFEKQNPQLNNYLQNIAIYFIWRYSLKATFDKDVLSKVEFMAISIALIKILFFCQWLESKTLTLEDCTEIVKNFSKEIEYSEDNLQKIEDIFYDSTDFSINNIIGIF